MSWARWCSWCKQKMAVVPTPLCMTCHGMAHMAPILVEDLLAELFPDPELEDELLDE